ncbi:TylF/MycF/NovP-related O-methyltransferase [Desulfonatronum thiodismutans]|uniref:TylF/MycF/NovP-related O-methyltransferase n=1 Tax=Desulfonatronum thiodismutans TaxID=159290 RepID=UPI00190F5D3F|nr:TylF/MycF/NovP-related O-methyltransferase [Desulfonatronum thiodismutans]
MIKKAISSFVQRCGYDIVRHADYPADFEDLHIDIMNRVRPYTLTSHERLYSLIESVKYILNNNINGAFLECGVYKGGSMMAVALTLMAEGRADRDLYLYDTYEGMPAPDERDVDVWGKSVMEDFSKKKISDTSSTWTNASLQDVKKAMALTGYPMDKVFFVKGLVEDTLPGNAPESVALLRLDTDWYKSTKHELEHLYPRLSPRGVMILDDYGHFKGAKQAVDEYFYNSSMKPLLHRIDYTGRLVVKGV